MTVHFLHIGKTGGTAVRYALKPVAAQFGIVLHRHETRLRDLAGAPALLTFREPAARFVSAFNSRLHMGQPRRNVPWREGETRAFTTFKTANDLAEALSPGALHEAACDAMRGIRHIARPQSDWATLAEIREGNVPWIGFTETLAADFERLKSLLSLPASVMLPADEKDAHRSSPDLPTDLSDRGRRNVLAWFADDLGLWEQLKS
jgi:hypothetical protein